MKRICTKRIAAGGFVLAVAGMAVSLPMAQGQQPEDAVETVTEAENVPQQAEQAPAEAQPLPPKSVVERNQATELSGQAGLSGQPDAKRRLRRHSSRAATWAPARRLDRGELRRHAAAPLGFDSRFGPGLFGFQLRASREPGLLVGAVRAGSAAADVGLQAGDRIVSLGGNQVADTDQFARSLVVALRGRSPDHHLHIPLLVRRGEADHTLYMNNEVLAHAGLAALLRENGHQVPPRYVAGYRGSMEHRTSSPDGRSDVGGRAYLGVELNPQFREAAIIARVLPGSAADRAGLREGDRIWGINEQRVESTDDLLLIMSNMAAGEEIELHFDRPHSTPLTLGADSSVDSSQHVEPPKAP